MVKKLTTDEFIAKARAKHGGKYDYSKVNYIDCQSKVIIICPIHGEFMISPCKHSQGGGCQKCGEIKKTKSRVLNNDIFIDRAKKIHGNKYDYSKVIYKTSQSKIIIICRIHGEFNQRPNDHYRYGCKKCGIISSANKQRSDTKTFIQKAQKIHDNEYDYSKVDYISCNINVSIKCKKHGIFEQTPNNHLRGQGCNDCVNEKLSTDRRMLLHDFIKKGKNIHGDNTFDYSKIKNLKNLHSRVPLKCNICHGKFNILAHSHFKSGCNNCANKNTGLSLRKTTKQYINEARKIHGNKYDYSKVKYTTAKSKIKIICKIHGLFEQEASSHLSGCGCPKCSSNGTYKIAQEWINLLLINQPELRHFYHEKGEFNIPNTNYKADGYNKTTKTIYEFHGDFWHGNPEIFNHKLMNDACKKTFGQLYKRTMKKQKECENLGYTYKSIWENDWIKGKMALKRIQNNFRKKQMLKKFPYQCEKCNYKCKFKSEYDRHCNSELHKTGKRGVKKNKVNRVCQICKLYEASCNTNLKNHILINHKTTEEREKEYTNYCKTCDYGSFSKKLFDKHLATKKHKKKEEMVKKLKDVD